MSRAVYGLGLRVVLKFLLLFCGQGNGFQSETHLSRELSPVLVGLAEDADPGSGRAGRIKPIRKPQTLNPAHALGAESFIVLFRFCFGY